MRQRLLEATVDCLVERGWSGTSTTLVSQRAGVSRGAQLHHYPTKADLVYAAVAHVMETRGEELRRAAATRPGAGTREVVEVLAAHATSPGFIAALELWVAARSDDRLRGTVGPLELRVGRQTHRLAVELLDADESVDGTRELVQATLDLCRGLGLATTLGDDSARRRLILDRWAIVLDDQLARRGTPSALSARPPRETRDQETP